MSCTLTVGFAVSLRQDAAALQDGPAEHGEDSGGNDEADPAGLCCRRLSLGSLGAAGEQNREDDEDGDGADVDQNLREAGELRVEFEEHQREAGERDGEGEGAVHGVLEQNRGERAGDGERGD